MGKLFSAALACASMSFAVAATAAGPAPPVGLRVYAENWNPAQFPGESLATLENSPTAISDALNSAWGSFRTWYLGTVPALLAQPDYLHKVSPGIPSGITLYSRTKSFQKPPELGLAPQPELKLVPEGANAFEANFHVPGSTISLCATTPTPAGQYGDPCATLSVDVYLSVAIKISDTPGQTLQVTGASVSLGNFSYGNENLPTQVIEALSDVLKFFGGPDYQALLAKTIDSQRQNVTAFLQKPLNPINTMLGSYEQKALAGINQPLQPGGISFSRLAHLAVWVRSSSTMQALTLLFAPPDGGVSIDPARLGGQFSGTLTFDTSVDTPPTSCAQLNSSPQIVGQVQTGPRPIVALDAALNPVYGNAPMTGLSLAFNGGALQGRQCPYTLSHLAVGLPNVINFSNIQMKASGQAQIHRTLDIEPSRWGSPVVLGQNGAVIAVGVAAPSNGGGLTGVGVQSMRTRVTSRLQVSPGASGAGAGASTPGGIVATQPSGGSQTLQSLPLIASTGIAYQSGVGALPQSGVQQIGKVNPGDPVLSQQARASTPASAALAGALSAGAAPASAMPATARPASTAPSWNQPGTASGATTPAAITGFSPAVGTSMRGTTTYGAPSTLGSSSLQRGQSTSMQQGTQPAVRAPGSIGAP